MIGKNEIIFQVQDAPDGGFIASAVGHSIFTQAETWFDLGENIIRAVEFYFEKDAAPDCIRPDRIRIQYEYAMMTLNMDLRHFCETEQDMVGSEKNEILEADLPDELPVLSFPATSFSNTLMVLGSMFIGFLAGVVSIIITSALTAPPYDDEKYDNTNIVILAALIGGGFVTGLLLSKFCLKRNRLQPLRLFVYSPVIFYIIIIIFICLKRVISIGPRDMSGILPDIGAIVAGLFISWIGALIGWGVHTLGSRRAKYRISNPSIIKG